MANLKGRKIEAMHRLYGVHHGKQCKECPHLKQHTFRGFSGYKCAVYGESCSEATDWRLKWQACGMIDRKADPKARPVVEVIHYQKDLQKPVITIDGQVSFDDL